MVMISVTEERQIKRNEKEVAQNDDEKKETQRNNNVDKTTKDKFNKNNKRKHCRRCGNIKRCPKIKKCPKIIKCPKITKGSTKYCRTRHGKG